jgi:DNA-binding CsgD family transcriptional regulator
MRVCGVPGMTMRKPRLIVASSSAALEACVERLERSGAVIRRGWEPGPAPHPADLFCVGRVETTRDANAALLAALGGAGIVAVLRDDAALSASFFEDLRRVGQVQMIDDPPQTQLGQLDEEQRRLLNLLSEGISVTAASRRLFLSRRTADRRLAAARAVLGVRSNAEAVIRACSATDRTV